MRELTSHKVNGLNEALTIQAMDDPGQGGACHAYRILIEEGQLPTSPHKGVAMFFQNGPVCEFGFNGISNEALLAIVEDRLIGFQGGQFACCENAIALTKIREAMMWLHKRTCDRISRGVEGTNQK